MKKTHLIKTSIAALVVLALAAPAAVMAQDVTDRSERATTDDLLRSASEQMDEEVDNEEEREVSTELDAESDVTREQVEDSQRTMSAEELDRYQRELQQRNERRIEQLTQIIESSPHDPQRPEWMFQKAEILWEFQHTEYLRDRNDYNACLDAVYEGTMDEEDCPEPSPDYGEAQELYEEILAQFPDYRRLDEVLFRLGSGLIDADEGAQAVEYLNRLVTNYPNSQYIADAYLALGDYFFNQHLTGAAKDNYVKVLDYDEYRNYDYALYQLGWTNFNMGEHRASADRFMEVVERAEGDDSWGLLPDRAANDLMLALAELPNGWIEARDYFTDIRDVEFAYEQLEQMAGHLEMQGAEDQAIEVYDWFLEERPNNPKVPDWMDAIARSLRDIEFAQYEERTVEFIDYLHRDGMWYRQNAEEERAINNAEQFVESNLARLGTHHHSNAQENDDLELYALAADYYQQFIDLYPEHRLSFNMTFFLGQIYLYNLEEYAKAARQFQHVVDLYHDGNIPEGVDDETIDAFVRDASYDVVFSYDRLVREHHPESVLVDMAERAGEDPELTAQGIDEVTGDDGETEPIERQELLEYEAGFVTASDQFSEMYPDEDITPTVDYVAAEIYRSRGHYDNCIPRYESIIENAPEHTYASFAGNSLLEANYRLERWDDVERWARHLMDNEIFDVTPKESLTSAIAFAINSRAIELEAEGEFDTAAEELLRLADEFPESELAPGALFNAAAIYESGDQVNRSVDIYSEVVDDYPESPRAPEALNILGLIFEARADFNRAAEYFARLGEEDYREADDAAYAVFNAAVLREAMEQWDLSIETYEDYLHYFEDRYENQNSEEIEEGDELASRQEVEYHLAYLEQEREQWADSKDRFEAYTTEFEGDISLVEKMEISLELARLTERLEPDDWEAANEHYDAAYQLWQDEEQWIEEFGEEGAERQAKRHEAAEARFKQAEQVFEQFMAVKLEFPPDRLRELAEEKGEYQQEAEDMYREVIQMGSPEWIAAASFRIGQSYNDFSEALLDLPIPEGLNFEQEMKYIESIEDMVGPLEDQALSAYENALDLALRARAYNDWSARSAAEISELMTAAYPITSQDGVNVEHSRTEFFAPDPVDEMSVVLERGEPRWERLRPPEPEFDIHDPEFNPSDHPEFDPADYPEFNPEDYPDFDPEEHRRQREALEDGEQARLSN